MLVFLVLSLAFAAEPEAPPPVMDALGTVLALDLDGELPRERKAQDAALMKKLTDLADAVQRLGEVVEDAGDVASLEALAEGYVHMAEAIRTSPAPTYLRPEQVEVYQMALDDKAYAQLTKAREAMDLAVSRSPDRAVQERRIRVLLLLDERAMAADAWDALGDHAAAERLRAEDAKRRRKADREAKARAAEEGPLLAAATEAFDVLQARHEQCGLEPALSEEIGMVLQQAGMVLEAEEGSMAKDVLALLQEYLDATEADCG